MNDSELERLIYLFSKLPGLGKRSARRLVLYLLNHRQQLMNPLQESIREVFLTIKDCPECGNLDVLSPCKICTDYKRDKTSICIVETVGDLWVIERSSAYTGLFHVLGGTLSALDGKGPDDLNYKTLIPRIKSMNIQEVILATNATVEGQTTAHFITEQLRPTGVKITQLAHGIPVGGELDYVDDGTLTAAIQARLLLKSDA